MLYYGMILCGQFTLVVYSMSMVVPMDGVQLELCSFCIGGCFGGSLFYRGVELVNDLLTRSLLYVFYG